MFPNNSLWVYSYNCELYLQEVNGEKFLNLKSEGPKRWATFFSANSTLSALQIGLFHTNCFINPYTIYAFVYIVDGVKKK